jgi:hypothetical protein
LATAARANLGVDGDAAIDDIGAEPPQHVLERHLAMLVNARSLPMTRGLAADVAKPLRPGRGGASARAPSLDCARRPAAALRLSA